MLSLRGNRDDFAFIIPYVRFRQDASSGQPIVLDTEAVIDGRALGILRSGFLHGRLIVPRFVPSDTVRPVSSRVSRAAACGMLSPGSSFPFGNDTSRCFVRCTSSTMMRSLEPSLTRR